jgi:hypothetical protein
MVVSMVMVRLSTNVDWNIKERWERGWRIPKSTDGWMAFYNKTLFAQSMAAPLCYVDRDFSIASHKP